MNRSNLPRQMSLGLIVVLLGAAVPCLAQNENDGRQSPGKVAPSYGALDTSEFPAQRPGVTGEAKEVGKAVVDRVFGVNGEAADIQYHEWELSRHLPANAAVRSALLPGWGQWFNRQPIKASAIFLVVGAGAVGSVLTYRQANMDYDTYQAIGSRDDPSYDDYTRHRTQALILGGATAALWVYSIWDAYHNGYNPLWSREPSVDVAFLDKGASLQWHRRF